MRLYFVPPFSFFRARSRIADEIRYIVWYIIWIFGDEVEKWMGCQLGGWFQPVRAELKERGGDVCGDVMRAIMRLLFKGFSQLPLWTRRISSYCSVPAKHLYDWRCWLVTFFSAIFLIQLNIPFLLLLLLTFSILFLIWW